MAHTVQSTFFSEEVTVRNKRRVPDGRDPVRDKILGCTNCELFAATKGPVPFRGPVPSRVCVVGEAPGKDEDAKGGPFLGPAGQLLQSELRANRVRPERIFYSNIVSCYPKLEKKTPTYKHINACRSNCWMQIDYSQAEWVLVVGGLALESLFPWQMVRMRKRKISAMHGVPWSFKGKYFFPCIHPAAGLRQEKYMDLFRKDIRSFVEQVRQGYPNFSEECYVCGKPVDIYTVIGIGYCKDHRSEALPASLPGE